MSQYWKKCSTVYILRYHGLHKDVSKADEEFGNVKGKSCTAVSFGKIKAGIPLLRTKGDIEGDMVGEKGSSFLSCWLWSGDEGGEGNLVATLPSAKAGFPPTAGEMAGKVDDIDSGKWVCWWRETGRSLGSWWGSFCFWHVDAKWDRSWVRTGTVILSAVIKNWDTLAAHSLNPARYFAMAIASSVNWRKRYIDKYHISHLWHLSLYLAPPVEEGRAEICWHPLEFSGLNFSLKITYKSAFSGCFETAQLSGSKTKRNKRFLVKSSPVGPCVEFSTKELERCNL